MNEEGILKPGESRNFKVPDSLDGIRFTVGRMVKMVEEARKDTLVIATARKIAALSTTGRKITGERGRDWWVLKGIHAWCRGNFEYVADPVNVELIQTPNRMLRELEIPPQLHMLMWKPIAKALGGKLPRPKMTGDSDEATVLSLSLAAAVGIAPLKFRLGGLERTIFYVWGAAQVCGKWRDIDVLHPKFEAHADWEPIEDVEIPL